MIWGSGSKGVSFLSNLGLHDEISAAVDINPHKWGKFMVGSGHRIISPAELVDVQPSLVIVMNPIYVDEIADSLRELGVECEVAALSIASTRSPTAATVPAGFREGQVQTGSARQPEARASTVRRISSR